MKKEYTKPNMEIVSFKLEENITEETTSAGLTKLSTYQSSFDTLDY